MKNSLKYAIVLVCCFVGVAAIIYSPDLYRVSHLNLGPCLALGFAGAGTLVWDSVRD